MSESRNSDGTYHSQKVYNFTSKFKELKPHKDNWKGDFIHGYYIDEKVCDDVIEYFNEPDPEKQMGEIVPLCDYVLICVKPQIFNKIKEALKNLLSDKQIVISIMAGISTENLCKGLGIKNAIRVMPNTPGQIGKGISVWYKKNKIDSKFEEGIKNILGALGESEEVYEEEIIDKATAISGSGPGYIFYFMESMLKSCKEIGIDENLSKKLIIKTFLGSA